MVALVDPRDMQTIDDLRMLSSIHMRLEVVTPEQLRQAIERSFDDFELVANDTDAATAAGEKFSRIASINRSSGLGFSGTVTRRPSMRRTLRLRRRRSR